MAIKKGDKVKFLNEQGGGVVVKILDDKQALVQIEDGFEIPVMISEIISTGDSVEVKESNEYKKPKPIVKEQIIEKTPVIEDEKKKKVFKDIAKPLLAIVDEPKNKTEKEFRLSMLNDGTYYFYYVISFELNGKLNVHERGELEPEMKLELGSFTYNDLSAYQSMVIDLSFFNEREYKEHQPIHYKVYFNTLHLLNNESFRENDFFDEPAIIIDLLHSPKNENKIPIKNEDKKPIVEPAKIKSDIDEVDLHIEQIIDDFSNLSNGEILNIQMAKFTTALDGAVINKVKRIVFIHGIGNGKLKYEIRKTLDNKYPDLKYQDASFAEYGYGATMVIIK
jgi:hypothetical protein